MAVKSPFQARLSTGSKAQRSALVGRKLQSSPHREGKFPQTRKLKPIQGVRASAVWVDEGGSWPVTGLQAAIEALQAISQRAEATSGTLGRIERTLAATSSTLRPAARPVLQYRGPSRR